MTGRQLEQAIEILALFGLDRVYGEAPMPDPSGAHALMEASYGGAPLVKPPVVILSGVQLGLSSGSATTQSRPSSPAPATHRLRRDHGSSPHPLGPLSSGGALAGPAR